MNTESHKKNILNKLYNINLSIDTKHKQIVENKIIKKKLPAAKQTDVVLDLPKLLYAPDDLRNNYEKIIKEIKQPTVPKKYFIQVRNKT